MDTLVQLAAPSQRRPPWLRIRLRTPERFHEVRRLVESSALHTVCQEARCPNIYECWGEHGTATFMILGDVCTRRCGFCAVTTGRPPAGRRRRRAARTSPRRSRSWACATPSSPRSTATTCPTAAPRHFADVIAAVHERNPRTAVEVLTPDFRGVARRARRRARSAARGVLAQHGDGAAALPRGAARAASSTAAWRCSPAPPRGATAASTAAGSRPASCSGLGEDADEVRATLARHPRRRRRDPHPRPVPAAHPRAPAGRPLGASRRVRRAARASRSSSASRTARRARWCASSYHAHEHVRPLPRRRRPS